MATSTVRWKGGRNVERVLKQLAAKVGPGGAVRVGFMEGARYTPRHPIRGTLRKPLPVAQVAFWNIYGTSRSPPRDFVGAAIRGGVGYWATDYADLLKAHNYDVARCLGLMGEVIKDGIVQMIVRWSQPPNSPHTVAIKGFNKPLIDDGTMQRSVTYQVGGL